jgi:uracil-DNA glycosylase family 4
MSEVTRRKGALAASWSSFAAVSDDASRSAKLRDLGRDVLSCRKCVELTRSRTLPVCGYGSSDPLVLFVGEAPGRLGADTYGVPFTGDRSGVLLQKMLGEIGLASSPASAVLPKLNRTYITNLVRCNPRSPTGNNRGPTIEEIANCSRYLVDELQILQPKVIATLGHRAAESVLGRGILTPDYAQPIHQDGFIVFPLHHPGFVIRGGGRRKFDESAYRKEFEALRLLLSSLEQLQGTLQFG